METNLLENVIHSINTSYLTTLPFGMMLSLLYMLCVYQLVMYDFIHLKIIEVHSRLHLRFLNSLHGSTRVQIKVLRHKLNLCT